MSYPLTWITPQLAVGHAPMSYAELDDIRSQGIDAILNLCGEFSDLHEIEARHGFEVHFLPIADEDAPEMAALEEALAWLDEALYLGKKVLVHCRHGMGRTGTVVSAYLLRKGFGLKVAEHRLRHSRANPTNFSQWRLLKRYGRQQGRLTIGEPTLAGAPLVDLAPFWQEYRGLVALVEEKLAAGGDWHRCGRDTDHCCRQPFDLELVESLYLAHRCNTALHSEERRAAMERAAALYQRLRQLAGQRPELADLAAIYRAGDLRCPLWEAGACLLNDHRPIRCRLAGAPAGLVAKAEVEEVLARLSRNVFVALSGVLPGDTVLRFDITATVSGRFTQIYFHYLAGLVGAER